MKGIHCRRGGVVSAVSHLFPPPPGLGHRAPVFGNGPAPDATVATRLGVTTVSVSKYRTWYVQRVISWVHIL